MTRRYLWPAGVVGAGVGVGGTWGFLALGWPRVVALMGVAAAALLLGYAIGRWLEASETPAP
jgi:hypothetical protein